MSDLKDEEKFIIELLAKNKNFLSFREIQKECEDKFEGVRLILKNLKIKGFVSFDGDLPSFNSKIELIKK